MSGFIEGEDRTQATLYPERIDDYVAEDSPVRAVDVERLLLKRSSHDAATKLPDEACTRVIQYVTQFIVRLRQNHQSLFIEHNARSIGRWTDQGRFRWTTGLFSY